LPSGGKIPDAISLLCFSTAKLAVEKQRLQLHQNNCLWLISAILGQQYGASVLPWYLRLPYFSTAAGPTLPPKKKGLCDLKIIPSTKAADWG
jgi:hypothetical protein